MIDVMLLDGEGTEVLDRDQCLRLLGQATLARIGVSAGALPVVLPIDFWLDGDRILVPAGKDSKLGAADSSVVAVEIDDLDPTDHHGWSVMVTGLATDVTDAGELARLARSPLARWAPRGGRFVSISTDMISGRRVAAGPSTAPQATTTRMLDTRTGIEALSRDECVRLLATDEVGRLAVTAGSAPAIFPVNYRLDVDDAIVFRTDQGTKLDHGPRSPACFEVDHFDRRHRSGWSVVVAGRLEEVTRHDAATLARLQRLPLDPWAGGDRAHWMRLVPARVTGRRVAAAPR